MEFNPTLLGELIGFVVFFIPLYLSLISGVVTGYHKLVWFLLSLFLSWIGFLVFYFTVVKSLKNQDELHSAAD